MNFAAKITGTGSGFPKNRVTNSNIVKKLAKLGIETSEEWIRERTGIYERRISDIENPKERNSSLAFSAAQKALDMAGKSPEDIDQIIYATCSPDTPLPSSACWLQHKLGAFRAWGMDINAACSGFIYGLATAEKFIRSGQVVTSLVVGAEVLSPILNWEDRNSCILFGDGAGAAIVEQTPEDSARQILSSHLLSDGSLWDLLYVPAGGSNMEVTPERYAKKLHKLRMKGKELFKVAVKTLADFALQALKKNHMTADDLDWFVPHQANYRIIEAVANRLEFPMGKIIVNVDRFGNTSAATIPTALDEANRDGRIKKGQTVLLTAFGAGLTYGSILMRW
ncbi:MAG: ketoacyl-ACP synthase III [Deltaproteobacteria bacterium]|jgi:3-oxoacyl-[acyl-carrier-protein] synthase-3|nr:ketoacyl-ACP synthase III [Deltaproteobacteria bacterium]MBW1748076.1 ketoacyl-ACP synthase III [Deltaproteobacteria bacterium]MBW2197327.1 ketoacyl-ACP synthase III [Deltaproteobacteria bacterium]MBW2325122.1 ketoacyl-ACP synthase III [Deltaproteobacteria bacterium]